MKHSLRLLLGAAALLGVGCAPATQRTYIAPSYETVVSTTEVHDANPPVHLEYVENHSTVAVIIFAITISDCQNIKTMLCGARPMNTRIDAGGRVQVARIEPENRDRAWNYRFGFSWRADTSYGTKVMTALAETGDSASRVRLAAMQHADSLRKAEEGPHFNELSRTDYSMIAGRVDRMGAYPESLVIAPGERTSIERIRVLLLDKAGGVLGQTRWVRMGFSGIGPVQFAPPTTLIAKRPGRTVIRFTLADEPQKMLGAPVSELEYPIVVAYAPDAHAPVFEGLVIDADSRAPLPCAWVALEDSAENVVARGRTSSQGNFLLSSPRAGTYRVRIETPGWEPVYGPSELAKTDEDKQNKYVVKFTNQMLAAHYLPGPDDPVHAHPVSLRVQSSAKQIVNSVTLGGSEAMPILGIVGRVPAGTQWMQFAVDSTGQVDAKSITLPLGADPRAVTSVTQILPRVRFSPARDQGKPVCELLRMQVNFSNR